MLPTSKINAAIQPSERLSTGVVTSEQIGLKGDGSPKIQAIHWALQAHYDASTNKLSYLSVSYLAWSGKNKGEYLETARLIPCRKTGLTVSILDKTRESLLSALSQFLDEEKVVLDIQQLALPPQWGILARVFTIAAIDYSQDLETLAQIKPVPESTWKDALTSMQDRLHWLKPSESTKAIAPKAKTAKVKTEVKTQPIQDAKSLDMIATSAEKNGSTTEVVTA